MAFRRGTRRARRRSSLSVARRWTGDFLTTEDTVAAAGTDANVIVAKEDYRQQAALEAGSMTLTRIRGAFNLRATVLGGLAFCSIAVIGDTEGAENPSSFTAYVTGDTLWHGMYMVSVNEPTHVDVDIKSARRLENDRVVFSISAVAQTITYTFNLRCLLLGG